MAPQHVCLFLLWSLSLFLYGASASFCSVTCSTDYSESVNCSCSAPTTPLHVSVTCRGEDVNVSGSCVIEPPQSWCNIDVNLDDVASIGTACTTTTSEGGEPFANEASIWELSKMVKPETPFNVQAENTDKFYNITWNHESTWECFVYMVRIRTTKDLLEDPVLSLERETETHILINHEQLQPHTNYTVDVQAKLCPGYTYQGPWSEWSPTADWRTAGPQDTEGAWWQVSLSVISLIILVLCLCYSQKTCWQRKLELITYIPKPNTFFDPLYINYNGNFKEWVKPAFSECDYLRISSNAGMTSDKQHDILHWSNEKQRDSEDNESNQGGHILHLQQPHSNLLLHFQDRDSSKGNSHSTGHISIHTVTLSGEEFDEEVTSQSSLRSYQDGESLGSFEEDNRYDLEERHMSRMDRQSGVLPQHENQIANDLLVENINFQHRAQFNEPERVSLDSFEQSEDGYPHVDLDTIDSGFGECGSPGASDTNTADQTNSDLFHEHTNSNSNYVKQWMVM
ncbi:interleukin-21 receptor-like [Archocentrus centrarchus]|uniref:interleukin-21 receptor-like n=1 Tax=Archocentrus centrarchus TaxID=63155 RepID=UPI0011EA141E|nr:interleukin-21 receptor-like [Archocentrus centrarchus]